MTRSSPLCLLTSISAAQLKHSRMPGPPVMAYHFRRARLSAKLRTSTPFAYPPDARRSIPWSQTQRICEHSGAERPRGKPIALSLLGSHIYVRALYFAVKSLCTLGVADLTATLSYGGLEAAMIATRGLGTRRSLFAPPILLCFRPRSIEKGARVVEGGQQKPYEHRRRSQRKRICPSATSSWRPASRLLMDLKKKKKNSLT